LNRSPSNEQRDVLEREARQRRGLYQRLLFALLHGRVLVLDLRGPPVLQIGVGEHRGRDLAARDVTTGAACPPASPIGSSTNMSRSSARSAIPALRHGMDQASLGMPSNSGS